MDWGGGFLGILVVYAIVHFFFTVLLEPTTWKPADISKPSLGPMSNDEMYYASVWMNLEE